MPPHGGEYAAPGTPFKCPHSSLPVWTLVVLVGPGVLLLTLVWHLAGGRCGLQPGHGQRESLRGVAALVDFPWQGQPGSEGQPPDPPDPLVDGSTLYVLHSTVDGYTSPVVQATHQRMRRDLGAGNVFLLLDDSKTSWEDHWVSGGTPAVRLTEPRPAGSAAPHVLLANRDDAAALVPEGVLRDTMYARNWTLSYWGALADALPQRLRSPSAQLRRMVLLLPPYCTLL